MALLFDKDIPRGRRLAQRAVEVGYRTGIPDLLIIAKSLRGTDICVTPPPRGGTRGSSRQAGRV
jgi:hypothetical protein